ncbi:MAG TPA: hypothetical protein VFN38_00455 [Gemmatimonadaceae bacterium]|nr:hypothetical protein [Gemmatimonadaceae bacterium]
MRVLLLDEGFISGAVTGRGLARAGCSVDVLAATGGRGGCRVDGGSWRLAPRVGDPRLLDVIDAAVRSSAYDIVYPVTEPLQWLLWDASPSWSAPIFPAVEEASRPARRDKRLMSELVARHGVSIPRQMAADSDDAVRDAIDGLGVPLVIKGCMGRGGDATRICATTASALSEARRLRARGRPPFAQTFVTGVTQLAGGLFAGGRMLRYYGGAKTAQFPARTGPAAELTSVDDSALFDCVSRVAVAAGLTGLASIDAVRDGAGRVHFLELNARPWGSIEAAERAGLELFSGLVQLWQGRDVAPRFSFRSGARSPIFPLYLLSTPYWRAGLAPRALQRDWRRTAAMTRTRPTLGLHLLHRLLRVGMNW